MEKESITKGSCLCGTVTYQYYGKSKVFQYCHCSRCQKVTGSAHASNIIVEPSHFTWLTGQANVGRFELPEAKHFAVSFCKTCGSNLPWLTQSKKAVVIPAGTLDDDPIEKPIHHIFIDSKAVWYNADEKLNKYKALPIK